MRQARGVPSKCAARLAGALLLFVCTLASVSASGSAPTTLPAEVVEQLMAKQKEPAALKDTDAKRKLAKIMASPDFAAEDKMVVPVWKSRGDAKPSEFMRYVERFFKWLAEILRLGVWVIGAIAIAILLVTLHYWWRMYAERVQPKAFTLPTHVGGLDIRAASLPDDIVSAARARWNAGDAVGALSLLYRGALSRLVLHEGARIRASFTETECSVAARAVMSESRHLVFARLTALWVNAVYAARAPAAEAFAAMCDDYQRVFVTSATAAIEDARTVQVGGA